MGLENSVSQKFHAQKLNRIFKEETYEFKAPLISLIPEEGFVLASHVQLALPAEASSLSLPYEEAPEVNKKVTSSPVLLCPPLPEIDFKNVNGQRQDEEENLEISRNVAETVSSFQAEIVACEENSELPPVEQLAVSPDQCLDNEGQQKVNYNPLLYILSKTRKELGFNNLPSEDLLLSSELNLAFKKSDSNGDEESLIKSNLSLQSQKTKSNSLSFTQVKSSVRAIPSSVGNECNVDLSLLPAFENASQLRKQQDSAKSITSSFQALGDEHNFPPSINVYSSLPVFEKAESLSQLSKQNGTEDGTKLSAPVRVKDRGTFPSIADFFPVNLAGLILSFHDDGG